jgi:two-component system, cell cycle sensor histidine kinase and response regulator CckA
LHGGGVRAAGVTSDPGGRISRLMLGILRAETRSDAIRDLCREVGAEHLLLFVEDPEIGISLPAPGFPQVIPKAAAWNDAAAAVAAADGARMAFTFPYPDPEIPAEAVGIGCCGGAALFAVGGRPSVDALDEIHAWLPWVAKVLRAESSLRLTKAREKLAAAAVQSSNRMSATSEGLRRHLEVALRKVESAQAKSESEKEERQKFVFLVENTSEFIGMATLDGWVTFLNSAGRQMVGLRNSEPASGRTLEDFLPEKMRKDFREIAIPACKASGQWEGELQLRHFQGGGPVDVWMNIFLVRDTENLKPVCLAMSARDITERKRSEEALRWTESQLQQSQKMESIGKLAGGIAHDFNNLLTAINGYAELSLDQAPPGSLLHANLFEIKSAGERAASLTRQLLAYSRKQVLATKVLNLNAIVESMHNMLARIIGEDLQLIPMLDPSLGQVKVDPGQMEQVILNLVVNSRDATPQGGRVILETRNVELGETATALHPEIIPGRFAMLAVSDSGCGMDPHVMSRIFEPFFTTKAFGKGSGMGLSMVQGIVVQSGGYIYAYSEPGNGSTFKIYLPLVESPQLRAPETEIRLPPAARGNETILLVEDEEGVRRFVRQILEMQGYRVLEASDGLEGIRVSEKHPGPVDLIVTDVIMPRKNGRELAQQVMRDRPGIKVIFMSGYTDDFIVREGLIEADTNFIQKPFAPSALNRLIRATLEPIAKALP